MLLAIVLPTTLLGAWWVTHSAPVPTPPAPSSVPELLFEKGILHHASNAALDVLPVAIGLYDWDDLRDILSQRFPDFPCSSDVCTDGVTVIREAGVAGDRALKIQISKCADKLRVSFDAAAGKIGDLTETRQTGSEELETLRQISRCLPLAVWKTDTSDRIVWTNDAYQTLCARRGTVSANQTEPLFDLAKAEKTRDGQRISINVTDSATPEWYRLTRHPVPDGAIYQAQSLAAVIAAEDAQRAFVQTLAKTFAHLSIGLAIFNRNRQLALFNPALIDLTGLPVAFLSPQPTIDSFFDRLRDNRRMPEPKNYRSWRQRIAELVSAAEHGSFEETWSLEGGQTYRIKGRPHPDGAIAFLIEDISAEVAMTRSFRAEMELSQCLIDTFPDGIAVFSQAGILTFSNKEYDRMWGHEPGSSFVEVTISDAIDFWKQKSEPNPMWPDLHDCALSMGERVAWDMPVCLKGKSPMTCRIEPIVSGSTMVRFSKLRGPLPLARPNMRLSEE